MKKDTSAVPTPANYNSAICTPQQAVAGPLLRRFAPPLRPHIADVNSQSKMSDLTKKTKDLAHKLYSPEEASEVCGTLEKECGAEALSCYGWSANKMERIWFAVLKVASEPGRDLEFGIKLAQADWRDLLMSAGFGQDLEAHNKWFRKVNY